MKKVMAIMAVLVILLAAGCSSEKSFAPSTLLSPEEGQFTFLFIFEESTPMEETSEFTDQVLDMALEKDLLHSSTITTQGEDFGIEVESFPVIVIIDSREIVLKAYNEIEALAFLEDQ